MNPKNEEGWREQWRRDQIEFENHWLWRELNTTPDEFFALVDACVAKSGIPASEWNRRLDEARQRIETKTRSQMHESRRNAVPTHGAFFRV